MHARAVVAINRLRHEGCRLAIGNSDVVDAVFVDLHEVGRADQRVELRAKLMLGLRDFVVMLFDRQAHLAHRRQHFSAEIVLAVDRSAGEVTTLHTRTVTQVALGIFLQGSAGAFDAVELILAVVRACAELDVVEDEEFSFRTKEGRVAQTGGLQILLCALGGGARVTVVELACRRVDDVADQDQLRLC